MSWLVIPLLILTTLGLSALFSGSEIGLYRLNRLRLHIGVQSGDRTAQHLARFVDNEQSALSTLLIGNNIVNYVATTAMAYLFSHVMRLNEFDAQLYTITLVTPLVFVFGEVVPKNLFQQNADRLMPRMIWILTPTRKLLAATGAIWLLGRFVAGLNGLFGVSVRGRALIAPKRRIAALLQEALAGAQHGEWQSDVIERVVQLSETPVRDVMIPLRAITSISATADRGELIRLARETGYARLPVVGARRTQVLGMVKIDTLLRGANWETVGESVEPALTLGPGETVLEAITRLRKEHREAALVTDRAGRMVGLITLRDLLQEIVGEAA